MFLQARVRSCFAFLFVLSSQLSHSSAFALGNLEEGKQFYAEGRLDKAARCFSAELAEDPHDASAHYLLANVFLALQQTSSAVIEYRKCAALDAQGQAGKLSRMALASISLEGTVNRAPTSPTVPAEKEKGVEAPNRSTTAGSARTTGSAESIATRTSASIISRETEERGRAAIAERDARVKRILAEGDQHVKALEKEMYERLNIYGTAVSTSPPVITTSPPGRYGNYSQSVRDEYAPQIEAVKRDTRRRADEVIAVYHDQAAAIEDSAISLDKEYVAPGSTMKLNPLGTNTYVRSYETADEPSGSVVPVQAAPAKSLKAMETKKSVAR